MLLFLSMIKTDEERELCEALYFEHRSAMFALAFSYLKNEYDSEDVVQTVFCEVASKYIKKLEPLDKKSRVRFLLLVTKYRALNAKERRSKLVFIEDEAAEAELTDPTDEDLIERICRLDEYEELRRAVQRLEPEERALLWMRFGLELSSAETAQLLGEKHTTVIKRLQRAKKRIASFMKSEEEKR